MLQVLLERIDGTAEEISQEALHAHRAKLRENLRMYSVLWCFAFYAAGFVILSTITGIWTSCGLHLTFYQSDSPLVRPLSHRMIRDYGRVLREVSGYLNRSFQETTRLHHCRAPATEWARSREAMKSWIHGRLCWWRVWCSSIVSSIWFLLNFCRKYKWKAWSAITKSAWVLPFQWTIWLFVEKQSNSVWDKWDLHSVERVNDAKMTGEIDFSYPSSVSWCHWERFKTVWPQG